MIDAQVASRNGRGRDRNQEMHGVAWRSSNIATQSNVQKPRGNIYMQEKGAGKGDVNVEKGGAVECGATINQVVFNSLASPVMNSEMVGHHQTWVPDRRFQQFVTI